MTLRRIISAGRSLLGMLPAAGARGSIEAIDRKVSELDLSPLRGQLGGGRDSLAQMESVLSAFGVNIYDVIEKKLPLIKEIAATTSNGYFLLSLRDKFLSRCIAQSGQWEQFELDAISRQLVRGDLAFDIGANVGWHTVCMARCVGPDGHVVAFEPESYNFRTLTRNLFLNGCTDIVLPINFAVSDIRGELRLEIDKQNLGDHRVRYADAASMRNEFEEDKRATTLVRSMALDEALADGSLGERASNLFHKRGVKLIKMDTQGSEGSIVRGAARVLDRTQTVLSEFWPYGLSRCNSSAEEYLKMVSRHFQFVHLLFAAPGIPVLTPSISSFGELLTLSRHMNGLQYIDLLLSKEAAVP